MNVQNVRREHRLQCWDLRKSVTPLDMVLRVEGDDRKTVLGSIT